MVWKVIAEGLALGALLVAFCAYGIRGGAVHMVFLYHKDVQERCVENGLITWDQIKNHSLDMKRRALPAYVLLLLTFVYALNGARGFWDGFWQMFAILFIANLIDRLGIDGYWVGHTDTWTIPGTEDLKPYINAKDKAIKWLTGTLGSAAVAAAIAGLLSPAVR